VVSRTGRHVPLNDDARMAKYIAGDAVDGFIETEKDIFAALKLEWRPPHERCC
jgi:DNA polymerase/3'-5' exonuclease PolX